MRKRRDFVEKAFDKRCMLSTALSKKQPLAGGIIILLLESGMEVYIEYAIIDNLIIDYVLLSASLKTCRVKHGVLSLAVGSTIGTLFAVLLPFMRVDGILLFLIKLLVGEVIVFASGRFKSFGQFFKAFGIFLLYTFGLGGGMVGVGFMLGADFSSPAGVSALSSIVKLPVGVIILAAYLGIKLLYVVIFGKEKDSDAFPFVREVAVFDGDTSVRLNAFIDTGNKLYDRRTGKPVSIISKAVADRLILNGTLKMRGAHYVKCSTVSGEGKILVFEIDRLVIYCGDERNIIDNAVVGISPYPTGEEAEVILHAGLAGGL